MRRILTLAVVWLAAVDATQAQDCNGNGVPDDIDLAGKMYWADEFTVRIQRADLDGFNVENLVTTGLREPTRIALDPAAGKMYWTDTDADKIQRADLDGANVEDLVTTGLIYTGWDSPGPGRGQDLLDGRRHRQDPTSQPGRVQRRGLGHHGFGCAV